MGSFVNLFPASLAVLLVLFTPIADPARISVADQVRRLEAGEISPSQFDFRLLRFHSGRYGLQALERLKHKQDGPEAAQISQKANEALDWRNPWQGEQRTVRVTPVLRVVNITVIAPKGQALPESFVHQNWSAFPRQYVLPSCLVADAKCEALMTDLDGDGQPEILLFGFPAGASAAFKLVDGTWTFLGAIANAQCAGVRDALRAEKFHTIAPAMRDIEAAGRRLRVSGDCAL